MNAVPCPRCKSRKSQVINSRPQPDGTVMRRRLCDCGERYTTSETIQIDLRRGPKPKPRPEDAPARGERVRRVELELEIVEDFIGQMNASLGELKALPSAARSLQRVLVEKEILERYLTQLEDTRGTLRQKLKSAGGN